MRKRSKGDLVFVAMMLGTGSADASLAMHDVTRGRGQWRVRAFKHIQLALASLEDAKTELGRVTRRPRR